MRFTSVVLLILLIVELARGERNRAGDGVEDGNNDGGGGTSTSTGSSGHYDLLEGDSGDDFEHSFDDSGDEEFDEDDSASDDDEEEAEDDAFSDDDFDSKSSIINMKQAPGKQTLVVDVAGADLGVPQILDPVHFETILDRIQEARNYFEDFVKLDSRFAPVKKICKNKSEQCGLWVALGECEKNPSYMRANCAPLCQSCEDVHTETRCPLDPGAHLAWKPGDLNKMFERITTDPEIQQYEPVVLSRPSYADGDSAVTSDYQLGPWVVLLDNFLTEDESERLIQLGAYEGYNRSSDVGDMQEDGTFTQSYNRARTSENAWCKSRCYKDRVTQHVLEKMTNVTKIHDNHAEYLQLLKYETGEFYKTHHDYIPAQKMRTVGVRIFTMFLYLNDVEEGGGTNFPELDLTVIPKRGRVLLWPSVHDEAPNSMDARTEHQALPVTKGVKYGANAWYHNRDFKTPHARGCQ